MKYDVIVVGYGLVGTVAALLLEQYGLRSAVFEQKDISNLGIAKSGRFDDEVMRIFQHLGLREAVERVVYPLQGSQIIDQTERVLLEIPYTAHGDFAPMYGFYQPDLQAILQTHVARARYIDIFDEHQVCLIEQDADRVQVQARHRTTHKLRGVEAKYIIVCNGANSEVAHQCNLDFFRYGQVNYTLNVDTHTAQPLTSPRYAQTIYDAELPVTRITNNDQHQRWEFQLNEAQIQTTNTPERVRQLIQQLTPLHFEINSVFLHKFESKILKRWRHGRIVLAGDAAHTMPPYLGLNLAAGIKDIYNLIWKLNLVINNILPDAALDSYKGEREPVVKYLIRLNLWIQRLFKSSRLSWIRWFVPVLPKAWLRQRLDTDTWVQYGIVGHSHKKCGWWIPAWVLTQLNGDVVAIDKILGNGFAILAFDTDPIDALWAEHVEYLAKLQATFIEIVPKGRTFEPTARFARRLHDHTGEVERWCKQHKTKFIVVRPDHLLFDTARDVRGLADVLDLLQRKMPLATQLPVEWEDLPED